MFNRVGNLKNIYMVKYAIRPNAVFFGHKEYEEAMAHAHNVNFHYVDPEFKTFMGMEMLEVDRESYLKVGLIEG
jgi:hypothetical protein